MTVGRICSREVDLAETRESARTAAQRMASRNVGTLVVVDGKQRPIGILTDRDLTLGVVASGRAAENVLVGEVMTRDIFVVAEDASIEDALERMRHHGVRRLPVVDLDRRLVGILSFDDVLALLTGEFHSMLGVIERSSPRAAART